MVPIYDTDIAEQRWQQSDWEQYELWEKVELRLRRNKILWMIATAFVSLTLCSVPIIMDRSWKWSTLAAARRLGQEINRIKREAGVNHAAYRIRFSEDGSLAYRVERSSSCSDPGFTITRVGSLVSDSKLTHFALLDSAKGIELGIPGLVKDVCYDYLAGSDAVLRGDAVSGFGIVPVNDLAEQREDRLSVLLVAGPSADVSFE